MNANAAARQESAKLPVFDRLAVIASRQSLEHQDVHIGGKPSHMPIGKYTKSAAAVGREEWIIRPLIV